MSHSDAELMTAFMELRKLAYAKLASPLRDAVLAAHEEETRGVKTAAELASIDKALFLHTSVP